MDEEQEIRALALAAATAERNPGGAPLHERVERYVEFITHGRLSDLK